MLRRRSSVRVSLAFSFWLLAATIGPSTYCAAFVVVRDRPHRPATIATTTTATNPSSTTALFSDGNPPPFGDWGAAPVAPAPAAPAPMSYGAQPPAPPSVPAPAAAYTAAPPAPAPAAPAAATTAGSGGGGGDPIATLQASQDAVVQQIQARIPDLTFKADLSWTEADNKVGGSSLTAYDAPGASNVAWLASVCIPGTLSSLTIFNGPLTDVPHVLSRACVVDSGAHLQVAVDVRPRAYGAYELRDPATGAYPGPEELGRKAFEYSGARNEFFGKFATDALQAVLDPAQFEGAAPLPLSELDRQTGGPLALHLQMPATDGNVARVAALRQAVAEAWLNWATEEGGTHEHRPGAPVNTQYVYDSKFRQNCYSALLPYYQQVLGGADGAQLAAAESGPLDEGYVGGGS